MVIASGGHIPFCGGRSGREFTIFVSGIGGDARWNQLPYCREIAKRMFDRYATSDVLGSSETSERFGQMSAKPHLEAIRDDGTAWRSPLKDQDDRSCRNRPFAAAASDVS